MRRIRICNSLKTSWNDIGGSFDVPSSLFFYDVHGQNFERTFCVCDGAMASMEPFVGAVTFLRYSNRCLIDLLTGTDGPKRAVAFDCAGAQWEQWIATNQKMGGCF